MCQDSHFGMCSQLWRVGGRKADNEVRSGRGKMGWSMVYEWKALLWEGWRRWTWVCLCKKQIIGGLVVRRWGTELIISIFSVNCWQDHHSTESYKWTPTSFQIISNPRSTLVLLTHIYAGPVVDIGPSRCLSALGRKLYGVDVLLNRSLSPKHHRLGLKERRDFWNLAHMVGGSRKSLSICWCGESGVRKAQRLSWENQSCARPFAIIIPG